MSWIAFSMLAALCWSITNIFDKFIITRLVTRPIVPMIITTLLGLLATTALWFVYGVGSLSATNIALALLSGVCYAIMDILYFHALTIADVSTIIPLFYLTPLFILIMAAITLHEVFSSITYLGIALLVIGAITISTPSLKKIRLGRAFWFMIGSSIMLALNEVITKCLLGSADVWTVFGYTRIGMILGILPLAMMNGGYLGKVIVSSSLKSWIIMIGSECINVLGVTFMTIATAIGFVTLVNAMASIQPFFVLAFAVILSAFYPHIINEEIRATTITRKIVAIAAMCLGAFLIG